MFQNAYQSGAYLEVFDAKVTKEKEKIYEKLMKISNASTVSKVYDKNTKGYIYEIDGNGQSKLHFPKDEKTELGLVQHFLVFQILIPYGTPFYVEIVVTDTNKNKRRLNFTSNVKALDKNYFHAKIPVDAIKRGSWMNLSFDIVSFFEMFKGQTFRSIDAFTIGGNFKLRRIFTMKNPLNEFNSDDEFPQPVPDAQLVPKTQNFAPGITYINQLITMDLIARSLGESTDAETQAQDSSVFGDSGVNPFKVKGISTQPANPKSRLGTQQEERTVNRGHHKVVSAMDMKAVKKDNKENAETVRVQTTGKKAELNYTSEKGERIDTTAKRKAPTSRRNNEFQDIYGAEEDSVRFDVPQPSKKEKSSHSPLRTQHVEERPNSYLKKNRVTSVGPEGRTKSRINPPLSPAREKEEIKTPTEKLKARIDSKGKKILPSEKLANGYNPESNLATEKTPASKSKPASYSRPSTKTSSNPWGDTMSRTKNSNSGKIDSPGKPTSRDHSTEKIRLSPSPNHKKAALPEKAQTQATPTKTKAPEKPVSKYGQAKTPQASTINKMKKEIDQEKEMKRFTTFGSTLENSNHKGKQEAQDRDEIESIQEEFEVMSNGSGVFDKRSKTAQNNYKDNGLQTHVIDLQKTNQKVPNSTKKSLTEFHSLYEESKRFERLGKGMEIIEGYDDFEDSLEGPSGSRNGGGPFEQLAKEKEKIEKEITNLEDHMQNLINKVRPFSPPFNGGIMNSEGTATITKKNNDIVVIGKESDKKSAKKVQPMKMEDDEDENMVEVVYDPVWNCYYDPKTNSYYEIKE